MAEVLERTDAALSARTASRPGPVCRFRLIYCTAIASHKRVLAGNERLELIPAAAPAHVSTPAQSCGGGGRDTPRHGVTHLISTQKK